MKINWKVRAKNPYFWIQIAVTIIVTVLGYAKISGAEVTTWAKVFELIKMVFTDPYCLSLVAVSVWNAINDPTTKGLKDSENALTYNKPKEV